MMASSPKIGISLDLINRHFQEPSRNRYESRYYWDELYRLIAAAGYDAIEMPYDMFWMFRGGSGVPMTQYCVEVKFGSVDAYRAHLQTHGIERIAGLHFDPTMFMRNSMLEFYFGATGHFAEEAVRYAAMAGCDYLNLTPTPPVGLIRHYHQVGDDASGAFDVDFLARTAEMINRLGLVAQQNGIQLILRHEYWSLLRGDKMQGFLASLDASVGLDFDAAHITISGDDPAARVRAFDGRIGSAHLTDTAFIDQDGTWKTPLPEFPQDRPTQVFRDPGEGNVDLQGFYSALVDSDFDGWAMMSCRQTRDPMRAILRTRSAFNRLILAA
jgi:inosose dehydratase